MGGLLVESQGAVGFAAEGVVVAGGLVGQRQVGAAEAAVGIECDGAGAWRAGQDGK